MFIKIIDKKEILYKFFFSMYYMTEYTTNGYFNITNNKSFAPFIGGGDFNILRQIFIKIIDKKEIQKIFNILSQFDTGGGKLSLPIFNSPEGGILIRLNMQRLSKYLGSKMLSTPRSEWINKEFSIKFNIKKYTFESQYKINKGEKIEGINFILMNMELKTYEQ